MSNTDIQEVIMLANATYADNAILAGITAAQAILESSLTTTPSQLYIKYHNAFGMEGISSGGGSITLPTVQYINNMPVKTTQTFRVYASLGESFEDHRELLEDRYPDVQNAKTIREAADGLVAGGYATDPDYADSLCNIYNTYVKEDN